MSISAKTRKYLLTGLAFLIIFIVITKGKSWWKSGGAIGKSVRNNYGVRPYILREL